MDQELSFEALDAKQSAHEAPFRDFLLGKSLTAVSVYTFQSRPADLLDDTSLLVFGGVDLLLGDQTLCMGFDAEMELLDLRQIPFGKMSGKLPITLIPKDELDFLDGLAGKKITACSFRWMHYFELDEEFEPVSEPSFAPTEIILDFEDGDQLQLAGINFQLMPDGQMVDPTYHPEGAILVAREVWDEILVPEGDEQA